jgi:flagellar biosynthesis protein FlhB
MKKIIHKSNKNFLPKILSCFILTLIVSSLVFVAYAATPDCAPGDTDKKLCNPLEAGSLVDLIRAVIRIVMRIAVIVAVVAIIWAGFLFVTAQGSEDKITKAKSIFLWTIVGVGIIVGANIIVDVIKNFFAGI